MPKSSNLQQTLWDLQKRFGEKAINPLSSLRGERDALSTGFAAVDALLNAQGLAPKQITELVGMPTSGLTTLTHHIIANAQGSSKSAAYLDLSGTFDPDYAVRLGVDLSRLLLVSPSTTENVLEIARDLVRGENTSIIVIDALTRPLVPAATTMRRLHEAVIRSRCTLLLLNATPLSVEVEMVATRLQIERVGWLYEDGDIIGYRVRVQVAKDKRNAAERETRIEVRIDRQVDGGAA